MVKGCSTRVPPSGTPHTAPPFCASHPATMRPACRLSCTPTVASREGTLALDAPCCPSLASWERAQQICGQPSRVTLFLLLSHIHDLWIQRGMFLPYVFCCDAYKHIRLHTAITTFFFSMGLTKLPKEEQDCIGLRCIHAPFLCNIIKALEAAPCPPPLLCFPPVEWDS